MTSKQFGGKITGQWKETYSASPHWKNGKFQNLSETELGVKFRKIPGMLIRQFRNEKLTTPKQSLPIIPLDHKTFLNDDADFKFAWYGHSVLLLRLNGKTILIDPMFGGDCSPIGPKRTRRFSSNSLQIIDQLPEIDLVLITHDHYDHLDFESILRLKSKVKNYFVALGIKRHLVSWGVDASIITEFDWWQSEDFSDIHITFTPSRHFSGRGLSSLAKCLWGGWSLRTKNKAVWFSGDSGYGSHFSEIGQKMGPFDIGFIECGQYCVDWPDIHMFPNEGVTAAFEANVKKVVPIHWEAFNLSYQHHWYEPPAEFKKFATEKSMDVITPKIGAVSGLDTPGTEWWNEYI